MLPCKKNKQYYFYVFNVKVYEKKVFENHKFIFFFFFKYEKLIFYNYLKI